MSLWPPLRLVRASVFAAVCVTLTCLGHWIASGEPMTPWTIAAGFAGVLVVALALAGHERSLATIFGGLLFGQFVLHTLFSTGHVHHVAEQPVASGGGGGAGMTAAHLGAAAVSAWWLRRGERRAWRLARQMAWLLVRPFLFLRVVARTPAGPAAMPPSDPVTRPLAVLLRHVLVVRGPPAGFRAL